MKKLLSILLTVALLLGTVSVLMLMPAVAENNSATPSPLFATNESEVKGTVYNLIENGDFEKGLAADTFVSDSGAFTRKKYEKGEDRGKYYLEYKTNRQETSSSAIKLPVDKSTEYTVSFDLKITDFGANGGLRIGFYYALGNWNNVALIGGGTQKYIGSENGYTYTYSSSANAEHRPGDHFKYAQYLTEFENGWMHFTLTFNSGKDERVFTDGTSGTLYLVLANFNNGFTAKIDNVSFGTKRAITAYTEGCGTATADKNIALPDEEVTFTATPDYGARFCGWYSDNTCVSYDNVFKTGSFASLTAKFESYNLVEDGGFENGTVSGFVARNSGVKLECIDHTENVTSEFGKKVLKVTEPDNDTYIGFYLPIAAEANTKYLLHISYKVVAEQNTRTEVRLGANSGWSSFSNSYFYASSAKYSYAPLSDHGAFSQYMSDNLKAHFGDGFIELNAVFSTEDELTDGNMYLHMGAYDSATFYIDNVSVYKLSDLTPNMLGASLVTETGGKYKEGTISYAATLNYTSPSAVLKEVGFLAMPTQLIPENTLLTKNTDNVSRAYIKSDGGLKLSGKRVYATFKNTDSINSYTKISARPYCVLSDKYGKFEWTFYSENENPAIAVQNGTYNRSVNQVKRLMAVKLLERYSQNAPEDFYSDHDVTAATNVKTSSFPIDKVWNFVKRNIYLIETTSQGKSESENLYIDGGFEDASTYLGEQRTIYIDTSLPETSALSFKPNERSYAVMRDYDPDGWIYYSGSDYVFAYGDFDNIFSRVDNSVITPHSGEYSLRLNTRAGTANRVLKNLKPNTDYELSFYWNSDYYVTLSRTFVYPYSYESAGTETVKDENGKTKTETLNGKEYNVNKLSQQYYFVPKDTQLQSEGLAYRIGSYYGDNTWQKVTLKFNTGSNTEVVFGLNFAGRANSGTVYIDDFTLCKSKPVASGITDSTFSEGTKNWSGTAYTYNIAGNPSATFTSASQSLMQTIGVEPMTDYTLTVKAYTKEKNALYFGVTDISNQTLNVLSTLSNTSNTVTDKTGLKIYKLNFNSDNNHYLNVHLQSLCDSKVNIYEVSLEKQEDLIVYDKVDFENSVTTVNGGVAPQYNIAKTNNKWFWITSQYAHSGRNSLVMYATSNDTNAETDGTTKDGDLLRHPLYQKWSTFSVQPGTYYKISYYAKAEKAGTTFESSVRTLEEHDWDYMHALDKKTITLSTTDWTLIEHVFCLETEFKLHNFADLVISGCENQASNIFFDDIVIEETIPRIDSGTPQKLYTEQIFNLIPDNDFENGSKNYSDGQVIKSTGAYNGSHYLRVNAGTKIVIPIENQVEYSYIPSTHYTLSAAVRKSANGKGYVGISYTSDGNNLLCDENGNVAETLVPQSTSWTFGGFSYASPVVTHNYIVIECTEGYIDVDYLSLFSSLHAFAEDPNKTIAAYYDYDDLTSAVKNGGTKAENATNLSIKNTTPLTTDFTGVNKTVYHPVISDVFGRQYTEAQWAFEIGRMKEAGITAIRTMFRSQWAYTGDENDPWNWDSEEMQQFYTWCNKLKEYGMDVAVILGWSVPYFVYGATSIPEVKYLAPRIYDENGKVKYTISWGILHPAIDFDTAAERYAEWGTQAITAINEHGVTNVTHALTFNEPSHRNSSVYEGAHAKEMLQLVEALVDKMNVTTLSNGKTVRESIKLVGSNQANPVNAGLSDYFLKNSKYGIDLYDIWTTHYVESGYETIYGPENDHYDTQLATYKTMLTNYKGKKPFWLDEFACHGYFLSDDVDDKTQRWWGVDYASQYVALMNSGMSGGILWQYSDCLWSYISGSGGAFLYGLHLTGATQATLKTQTPYYSYYAITLLTKYMSCKDNSSTYLGESGDAHIHTSAVQTADGNWSVLVVNNNLEDKAISIKFDSSIGGKNMYRHVYNYATVTPDSQARVIDADKTYSAVTDTINDTIPAGSVVIYTTMKGNSPKIDTDGDIQIGNRPEGVPDIWG